MSELESPVLLKEVGSGLMPADIELGLKAGVTCFDLAGTGEHRGAGLSIIVVMMTVIWDSVFRTGGADTHRTEISQPLSGPGHNHRKWRLKRWD